MESPDEGRVTLTPDQQAEALDFARALLDNAEQFTQQHTEMHPAHQQAFNDTIVVGCRTMLAILRGEHKGPRLEVGIVRPNVVSANGRVYSRGALLSAMAQAKGGSVPVREGIGGPQIGRVVSAGFDADDDELMMTVELPEAEHIFAELQEGGAVLRMMGRGEVIDQPDGTCRMESLDLEAVSVVLRPPRPRCGLCGGEMQPAGVKDVYACDPCPEMETPPTSSGSEGE